jgi:hypothetical protein
MIQSPQAAVLPMQEWKDEAQVQKDHHAAHAALEKELKEFSGGLPYDQARVIERTQDGLRQGVYAFYLAGLGLILIEKNEGVQTFGQILGEHFPGISRSGAYAYMQFARCASKLPNFKQFCLERGGYSKGLTMLQSCSEAQIEEFDQTGEVFGFTQDQIDNMSVLTLKKALRRAKEKEAQAVKQAVEKTATENSELKQKVDELTTALATPDLEAAIKLIRAADAKVQDALQLLRKVDWRLVSTDWTVRLAALQVTNLIGTMVGEIEANILSQEMPEPPAKGGGGE